MIDLSLSAKPKASPVPYIKDTDDTHVEQDVFLASMETPVILQFWAQGSVICQQMMTALEKLVTEAAGAVILAKANINKSPGLAQALRIQSVPTVYIFFQGKPVDAFAGPKTEPELRALVEGLKKMAVPAAPDAENKAAIAEQVKKLMGEADDFFKQDKLNDAMERFGLALDLDAENMEALGGIGWCLLNQGEAEAVRDMLTQVTPEQLTSPRLKGLQYVLSLGDDAKNILGLIDRLVAEVKKNREGGAKEKLIELFDALGPAHPLTIPSRRKLSTVLFS